MGWKHSLVAEDTGITVHEKSQEGMEHAGIPGRCGLFVESPQDPAEYLEDGLMEKNCPSFWEWMKIQVDQGALGYTKPKPTTLMTNMAQLRELDGVKASQRHARRFKEISIRAGRMQLCSGYHGQQACRVTQNCDSQVLAETESAASAEEAGP